MGELKLLTLTSKLQRGWHKTHGFETAWALDAAAGSCVSTWPATLVLVRTTSIIPTCRGAFLVDVAMALEKAHTKSKRVGRVLIFGARIEKRGRQKRNAYNKKVCIDSFIALLK